MPVISPRFEYVALDQLLIIDILTFLKIYISSKTLYFDFVSKMKLNEPLYEGLVDHCVSLRDQNSKISKSTSRKFSLKVERNFINTSKT